jgi:hypothetical protein
VIGRFLPTRPALCRTRRPQMHGGSPVGPMRRAQLLACFEGAQPVARSVRLWPSAMVKAFALSPAARAPSVQAHAEEVARSIVQALPVAPSDVKLERCFWRRLPSRSAKIHHTSFSPLPRCAPLS